MKTTKRPRLTKEEKAYREFVRMAKQEVRSGFRISAMGILSRLRYKTRHEDEDKRFKLNNSLAPKFARRLIAENPKLSDKIELRNSN